MHSQKNIGSTSSVKSIDPAKIRISRPSTPQQFTSHLEAALYWHRFGFSVIPALPNEKRTAVTWDSWLANLSNETIIAHWSAHPDHEIGFIVGESIIVLDADSPESIAALQAIEEKFGFTPKLADKTSKGMHHFFQLASGTFVHPDSHSTEKHPERIDIKTGRSLVMLPNSTGKHIERCEIDTWDQLSSVSQDFIDAVFAHNGRDKPRPFDKSKKSIEVTEPTTEKLARIKALLQVLDADCGRDDWVHILMAIFYETSGSDEGFEIADAWSSTGGLRYKGTKDVQTQWKSFKLDHDSPYTMATLIYLVNASGKCAIDICLSLEPDFVACKHERIEPATSKADEAQPHPLERFSLRGRSDEIAQDVVEATPVLDQIALKGQLTIIFASANTGKTLITIFLLIESMIQGRIAPQSVYYLNMDDNSAGLLEKLHLAEEYGFHMLADGFRGLSVKQFMIELGLMIEGDEAYDTIIILDTLKKFSNVMDKGKSAAFNSILRKLVIKGGTVIALAHTNKQAGADGKPVYGGTSDSVDDADCAFIVRTISQSADSDEKIVEFENIKSRGNVAPTVAFGYSLKKDISYAERLISVRRVDDLQLVPIKKAEQLKSDAEMIVAIESCIRDGINSKMLLAEKAAERCGASKRAVIKIIEKYTGNDPALHRWSFDVRARGAKVFVLLDQTTPDASSGSKA